MDDFEDVYDQPKPSKKRKYKPLTRSQRFFRQLRFWRMNILMINYCRYKNYKHLNIYSNIFRFSIWYHTVSPKLSIYFIK